MTNFPEWVEDNVDHSIRTLTGKKKNSWNGVNNNKLLKI